MIPATIDREGRVIAQAEPKVYDTLDVKIPCANGRVIVGQAVVLSLTHDDRDNYIEYRWTDYPAFNPGRHPFEVKQE